MAEKKKNIINGVSTINIEALIDVHPLELGERYNFLPLTDVVETDEFFVIEMEVPGVKKEDLVIEVNDNYINIVGKKHKKDDEGNARKRFYCMGRIFGTFRRIFEIPSPFNIHQVRATLDKGVLTIKLPKIVDKRQRKIIVEIE